MEKRMLFGSDKEMAAVMNNMKEQRALQQNLNTINLEQTYSMKLIELDERFTKVGLRARKARVSKIKSYLEPEQIADLRKLEVEGKWRCRMTLTPCSAVTIAAAAKRLHLDCQNRKCESVNMGSSKSGGTTPRTARSDVVNGWRKPSPMLTRYSKDGECSPKSSCSSSTRTMAIRPKTAGAERYMTPTIPKDTLRPATVITQQCANRQSVCYDKCHPVTTTPQYRTPQNRTPQQDIPTIIGRNLFTSDEFDVNHFHEERRKLLLRSASAENVRLNEKSRYFIEKVQSFVASPDQINTTCNTCACDEDKLPQRVSTPMLSLSDILAQSAVKQGRVPPSSDIFERPLSRPSSGLNKDQTKGSINRRCSTFPLESFINYWDQLNRFRHTCNTNDLDLDMIRKQTTISGMYPS